MLCMYVLMGGDIHGEHVGVYIYIGRYPIQNIRRPLPKKVHSDVG